VGAGGSSVSIVSDHRLGDGFRSPTEAKDLSSSLCVETTSEAKPASYPMRTVCPFPGGKARPERVANHSTLSSAKDENEEIYILSPCRMHGGSGTVLH
jgi:hypothetical protein